MRRDVRHSARASSVAIAVAVVIATACGDSGSAGSESESSSASGTGPGGTSGATSDGSTGDPGGFTVSGSGTLEIVWQAAVTCTGLTQFWLERIDLDADGNVLVGGGIGGACDLFGETSVDDDEYYLIAASLARDSGAALWTRADDPAASIFGIHGVGGPGGLVIHGDFDGSIDLGDGVVIDSIPLGNTPDRNPFWYVLDGAGVPVWTKSVEVSFLYGFELAMDGGGELVLATRHDLLHAVDLGGGESIGPGGDTGVARFAADGTYLWGQNFSVPLLASSGVEHVVIGGDGAIYLTGSYRGGSIHFGDIVLPDPDEESVYVARLSPDGEPVWARAIGDQADACPFALAVDDAGAASIAGVCPGELDFGAGPLGASGELSGFVARYDAAGAHDWSRELGGAALERVHLATDGDALTIGVTFHDEIDLGDGALVSAGARDIALAQLDDDGATAWSQRFGGEYDESLSWLVVDDDGSRTISSGSFGPTNGTFVVTRLAPAS